MTIHVEDLKFQCIIGILDFERVKTQDVIVDIDIEYDYENEYIDYAKVVQIIKDLMIKSKYELIEDALNGINLKLNKEFKNIKSIDLKIAKPSIIADCKVSVSSHFISKS
jgi:dihydroneopterin aldolase